MRPAALRLRDLSATMPCAHPQSRSRARPCSFFLHPDLRDHPTGLSCVIPLMNVVPALRSKGVKIVWVYVSLRKHLAFP